MGRAFINFKLNSLTHQQMTKECSQMLFPRAYRQLYYRYQVTCSGTKFLAIVNVAARRHAIQNLYLHFHQNQQDNNR